MNIENIILYKYIILFTLLIIISIIDLKTRTIPFKFICIGIILGIAINIYISKKIYIFGFLLGGLMPLLLAFIGDGGVGGGDIQLLAMIGLWVGFEDIANIMLILFSITAIVLGILIILSKLNLRKQGSIAFAPYITVSTIWYFILNYYIGW